MSERATVYCDESGNDGPNYLNKKSPFFVLAGWVVPHKSIVEASVAIQQLLQTQFKPGTPELKFRLLDRNDYKRKILVEFIGKLGKLLLTPVYLVAEKRYCIAGKIVETFLDPDYNSLAKAGMTWNIEVKQEIANVLYEHLPQSALERFANAYRNPTEQDLILSLTEIEAECQRYINPELARFLHGSYASIAEIAAVEVEAAAAWDDAGGTLNLPCVISFIMMIEQMGRSGLYRTDKIVHDEIDAYEDAYKAAFLTYKNGKDLWVTFPGARHGHGTVLTVDSFEIQKSVKQPLIQAADVLAGAINNLCVSIVNDKELTPHEIELGKYLLTPLLFTKHNIAFPICSGRMLAKLGNAIRQGFPEFSGSAVQSSSGQSDHYRIPLLPPQGGNCVANASVPKRRIDLPLFGIATGEDKELIVLEHPEPADLSSGNGPAVPLFTTHEGASAFLSAMQPHWAESHTIRRFDAQNLSDLVVELRKTSQFADLIVFDLTGLMSLPQVIKGLEMIIDRMFSAIQTGAIDVISERQTIEGIDVVSLLLSSGEYGAMRQDGGDVFRGKTREQAVAALVAAVSSEPNA